MSILSVNKKSKKNKKGKSFLKYKEKNWRMKLINKVNNQNNKLLFRQINKNLLYKKRNRL